MTNEILTEEEKEIIRDLHRVIFTEEKIKELEEKGLLFAN